MLFAVLGLAGAWVAGRIEERPRVILAVLILFGVAPPLDAQRVPPVVRPLGALLNPT